MAMRRREFIGIIGAAATTALFATRAQAERVRRIGILMIMDASDPTGQSEIGALKQGLQELGWIEGSNLQIEQYWPGGQLDRIQAAAKEIVALKCEVIVTLSTPAVAALLNETRVIPIVFAYVFDPVDSGFVRNFARPEGNATGFQTYEPTIVAKWLQLLLEMLLPYDASHSCIIRGQFHQDSCVRLRRWLPRLQSSSSLPRLMSPQRSILLSPNLHVSQARPNDSAGHLHRCQPYEDHRACHQVWITGNLRASL